LRHPVYMLCKWWNVYEQRKWLRNERNHCTNVSCML